MLASVNSVLLQGYEDWTIDLLLSNSIIPNNIKVNHKEKPVIKYDWNGNVKKYFPDCYLLDSKTIVETKSDWTFKIDEEQIKSKIAGSIQAGYNFRLIIWNSKHELVSDKTYTA